MARVLVIDDEAELLDMMRLVLERRGGHQAILSADGKDGLAKAIADPPDLAIIDVMMPGMNGYDVCRQLRANPATAELPIIVLTARAQPMDRDAALAAGANAYMSKPVLMPELLEKVNAMLAEREAAKAAGRGVLALLSLRGGVGVTTLAVNLAATLIQTVKTGVCLVDFCPSSGHVALQLGLRPEPNWSGLIQAAARAPLSAEMVEAHLLSHSSGLRVLASPLFPVVGQGFPQELATAIIQLLQPRYIIIADLPSTLDPATMAVLEIASAIGVVLTAEPPSIQTTIGVLRVLNPWADKLHIILNQVTPGPQTPADAIARMLKRAPAGDIPFDAAQVQVLGRGAPLALSNPAAPLSQAVQRLAQTFH